MTCMQQPPAQYPRIKPNDEFTDDPQYGWIYGRNTWKVPFGWNKAGTTGETEPVGTFAENTTQIFTITADGDVKIEKLGHSAERKIDGRLFLDGVLALDPSSSSNPSP